MYRSSAYAAIRLWGSELRSSEEYIKREQAQAAQDAAPLDAIFYSQDDKRWRCVSDLRADHPFREMYMVQQRKEAEASEAALRG